MLRPFSAEASRVHYHNQWCGTPSPVRAGEARLMGVLLWRWRTRPYELRKGRSLGGSQLLHP